MTLGIISDTHDRINTMIAALDFLKEQGADVIVHCGDWKGVHTLIACDQHAQRLGLPLYAVLGNNDLEVSTMLAAVAGSSNTTLVEGVLELTLGSKSIAVYHGHHTPTLRKLLEHSVCDIILLGHTHKPRITIGGQLVVNPGSTAFSIPRSKEWRPSVATVDTDSMTASIHYVSS